MWFSLCGPLVWILIVLHNLSVLGVLLFCLFLFFFLKSYFVFSLWSGYNTIIWWFFIYLNIYNFSWIQNTFSKEFLRFYEVLTNTSSRQLVTYVLYWVYHQSMSLLFTFNFFSPTLKKKKISPTHSEDDLIFFFFFASKLNLKSW